MILFGASGHCKVVLDILLSQKKAVDYILDDQPKVEEIFGVPVLKNNLSEDYNPQKVIVSIGNNYTRKKIVEKYSFEYTTAVHHKSTISIFADIKEGTVVMANAVVNPGAKIGRHCIINTSAVIEHDCRIEDYVHVSPNASLAGNVCVKEGAHIGIGAQIIQGVTIGKWATVGAGAVILRDVPDFAVAVGNPCKIIKIKNSENE